MANLEGQEIKYVMLLAFQEACEQAQIQFTMDLHRAFMVAVEEGLILAENQKKALLDGFKLLLPERG